MTHEQYRLWLTQRIYKHSLAYAKYIRKRRAKLKDQMSFTELNVFNILGEILEVQNI